MKTAECSAEMMMKTAEYSAEMMMKVLDAENHGYKYLRQVLRSGFRFSDFICRLVPQIKISGRR
jgi:hypothetical protein